MFPSMIQIEKDFIAQYRIVYVRMCINTEIFRQLDLIKYKISFIELMELKFIYLIKEIFYIVYNVYIVCVCVCVCVIFC